LLRDRSAREITASIADAAERWSDADFPPRVRATAAIEARLGYTTPVVDFALDQLFFGLRRDALEAAIVSELGSLAALDGPVPVAGRPAAWARGVDRVTIVSSDTTIGVALPAAAFALCAKCDVLVKDRSDALIAAFFATLVEERPEFVAAAVARPWTGASDPDEAAALGTADVVVAYGGDDALRAIRAQLRPDARFVPFGHRASIGYVAADATAGPGAAARCEAIARDALLYDGEGCLSLHALFVEGPDARAFASQLAAACERVAIEFPPGALDARRAAAVASYRNLGDFRAAGGRGAIVSGTARGATIAFDPPRGEAPPFLPRVLPVYPVRGPGDVAAYCAQMRLPVQALGVADPGDPAMLALGAQIGAVRIAAFGTMQTPPLAGHHGGAPRIADFVRWIDCA
jgi:hypothetical protein